MDKRTIETRYPANHSFMFIQDKQEYQMNLDTIKSSLPFHFSLCLGSVVSPLTVLFVFLFSLLFGVSQIQSLVTDSAGHKLLVLSGQSSDHGGLLLQSGVFTYQTFSCVFADPGVSQIYGLLILNSDQLRNVYCTFKNGLLFI